MRLPASPPSTRLSGLKNTLTSVCAYALSGPPIFPLTVKLDMEKAMLTAEVIDYAMPLMNIERLAKECHDLCLHNKFEEANELALKVGVEARILSASLAIMQGKETSR